MERLTKKFTDGGAYCEAIIDVGIKGVNYPTYIGKVADKLAEYEDAEEQGLLLRLPVAIGSTLYQKRKDNMIEFKTIGITYNILSKEWLYEVAVQSGVDWIKTVCSMECVGKTVFLTKEEAEQALKQMGE